MLLQVTRSNDQSKFYFIFFHESCISVPLPTEEFSKYGNFCMCTAPCTEDLFVASVSISSMSVNLESISGAAKVKLVKLQSRLETAREITFRSVKCRKGRASFSVKGS